MFHCDASGVREDERGTRHHARADGDGAHPNLVQVVLFFARPKVRHLNVATFAKTWAV